MKTDHSDLKFDLQGFHFVIYAASGACFALPLNVIPLVSGGHVSGFYASKMVGRCYYYFVNFSFISLFLKFTWKMIGRKLRW